MKRKWRLNSFFFVDFSSFSCVTGRLYFASRTCWMLPLSRKFLIKALSHTLVYIKQKIIFTNNFFSCDPYRFKYVLSIANYFRLNQWTCNTVLLFLRRFANHRIQIIGQLQKKTRQINWRNYRKSHSIHSCALNPLKQSQCWKNHSTATELSEYCSMWAK